MRADLFSKCRALAVATSIALLSGAIGVAHAQDLPAYMAPIVGTTISSPTQTATKNVLALNTGMFELYSDAARVFRTNILAKHPVILGLFSGSGDSSCTGPASHRLKRRTCPLPIN